MKITVGNWGFKTILPMFLICSVLSAANASIQPVSRLGSSFAPPAGGDSDSELPIITADGRYVLFTSTANNLTLTNNNNSVLPLRMNVFLRDRVSGTTTLVSANLPDTGGGNDDSYSTGISANGRFALLESAASNLVVNDTNGVNDVFVRDLVNGITTPASVANDGSSAHGASFDSVMTPDGRYVAFVSAASNLVTGDTNNIPDVFVRDLQAGTTTLASVGAVLSTNSTTPWTSIFGPPKITPDGRYVVFYSVATNLAPGVTIASEIYVRDLVAGSTTWVSTNARAIFQSVTHSTNAASCNYCLSDDGQFVAYEVCTNVPNGTPAAGVILRYHLQTGLTDIIYTNASVANLSPAPEDIDDLAMTPDGRFVAFVANIGNTSGTNTAIYLWDAQTSMSTLITADLNNPALPANGMGDSPAISPDGQWIAFISSATDLTTNTLAAGFHVYLRNVPTGVTQLLDADTNGVGVGVDPTTVPAMSADGSVVAFATVNLLNDNRHMTWDVFARGTESTTGLISAHHPALPSQMPNGITTLTSWSVSSNGQFVAFHSDADDMVTNDTNGCRDVFVRDLIAGTNILVSVNTNGVASDGISTDPAISGDGRYVAFSSSADDLVLGDTNKIQDVFLHDMQSGTTTLVSVSTNGLNSGNGDSFSPTISTDGRYVLFHSKASNLAAGSFGSGVENLFFRDLQTVTTYALTSGGVNSASMTPDGHWVAFIGVATGVPGTALYAWNSQSTALTYTNSATASQVVSISPNGQKLAYLAGAPANLSVADLATSTVTVINPSWSFAPQAGLQFSADGRSLAYALAPTGQNQDVYLYDLQTGTNRLVSQSFNSSGGANDNSDSPVLSADGRFVAYRSLATDLVPDDFNNVPDLFIYDTSNNATILVSVNAAGTSSADDRSLNPVFSADGHKLVFQSWASDVSGNDFNNGSDVYALDLTALPITSSGGGGSTNPASIFYAQLLSAGSSTPNPTVSWQLASGKTYQVQYKNDLGDPLWQNVTGNIIFIGDTGYVTDPSPPTDKRFYRIVLSP
jgi:Tol biopolymer transport system component